MLAHTRAQVTVVPQLVNIARFATLYAQGASCHFAATPQHR